jgi:cytochrome c-type biogenesis protein
VTTALVFAFGAGMLATVNPCGFALLPAFFAYYLGSPSDAAPDATRTPATVVTRIGQGFLVGLAVSAGFAAVFTVVGLLVSVGLRSLVAAVPWAAVVIGAGLVALGAVFLTGRQIRFRLGHSAGTGAQKPAGYRGLVAFGAAYAVASLSCTLAVLLSVVAQATATANPLQLLGVFAAYATGAASVLIALAIAAALAKETLARKIRRLLPVVTRLGGAVLVLSGVYLVLYWLPTLTGNRDPGSMAFITERISAQLTGWLNANQGAVALAAAVVAVTGAVAAVRTRTHSRPSTARDDSEQVEDCCAEPRTAGNDVNADQSQ